ncbi:MAG: transglycosylase SLT domain-containing protein [Bryobacteraceae bacterium]
MTIRNLWAATIPALWLSASIFVCAGAWSSARAASTRPRAARSSVPSVSANDLPGLVRAYRESPSAVRRAAIERYAAAHPAQAHLAALALGVAAYEQKDWPGAVAWLRKARPKLAPIADYLAYYLAAARLEMADDASAVIAELAPVRATIGSSPVAGKAWLVEARAREAADPAAALRLLRDRYAELSQPDGDLTLADCYQSANELASAVEFYQRAYDRYLSGDAAKRAAAALVTLRDAMGAAFPQPLPQQLLRRADRLLDAHRYSDAEDAYRSLEDAAPGLEREQAEVRAAAIPLFQGDAGAAGEALRALHPSQGEAEAERLYRLVECARRLQNDDDMMAAVKTLGQFHGGSVWRLKALVSAANRFLVDNRAEEYVPLYRAAAEEFPSAPGAAVYHWKVAFYEYLHDKGDAGSLLREQIVRYPGHSSAASAAYFLGRQAESEGDFPAARVYYEWLASARSNYYYGMLARACLARAEVKNAKPSQTARQFLASASMAAPLPLPSQPTAATTLRIRRSRLLRSAGLADLADAELRFGARTDGQPALLAFEMAEDAPAAFQAVRILKTMVPEHLSLALDQAPRKFWELLFPLPYRGELEAAARRHGLDPSLVAGLIRQESEFNPAALSSARAYGLTQVLPATGRRFARKEGIPRFTPAVLLQPAANLRIGTSIIRSMLDSNNGSMEQTLAAYNAGPNRVAEWLSWANYREPAEFVESIPFTETRDYVQAVLRNADMYRRLYGK